MEERIRPEIMISVSVEESCIITKANEERSVITHNFRLKPVPIYDSIPHKDVIESKYPQKEKAPNNTSFFINKIIHA